MTLDKNCTIKLNYNVTTDPVEISENIENKTLTILSNGEIRTSSQEDQNEKDERIEAEKRFRRSISRHRSSFIERENRRTKKRIETLVVADKKFIEKHKNDERSTTIYILTIMNMVRGN